MMVVRRYIPTGSLRDLIYGVRLALCRRCREPHTLTEHYILTPPQVRPNTPLLQKYVLPAKLRFLSIPDIRKFGRQVLEALHFLSEKGFVLGMIFKRENFISPLQL